MIKKMLERNAVSTYEKMVYIVIHAHQDDQGLAVLSHTQISRLTSASKRQVINVIASLIEKGLIEKEVVKFDEGKIIGTFKNVYKTNDPGERI